MCGYELVILNWMIKWDTAQQRVLWLQSKDFNSWVILNLIFLDLINWGVGGDMFPSEIIYLVETVHPKPVKREMLLRGKAILYASQGDENDSSAFLQSLPLHKWGEYDNIQ